MPDEEQLKSRRFVLFNDVLYFKGDRSWLMITNFITGGKNISLTYADLNLITTIEGDVTVADSKKKKNFLVFSDGKKEVEMACLPELAAPDGIAPPPTHEFSKVGELLTRGRSIYGLMDPYAVVNVFNDGTTGYMALLSSKGLAGLPGPEMLDMNITKMPLVLKAAVAGQASMKVDKDNIYFMLEEKDHTIYTAMNVTKSTLPDKPRSTFVAALNGHFEQNAAADEITIATVQTKDLLGILPTLEQMEYAGFTNIRIENGTFKLTAKDTTNREFRAEIACDIQQGAVDFGCRTIDRSLVEFLGDAAGRTDETLLRMVVNIKSSLILISMIKNPTKKDATPVQSQAFVMMKIDTGVGA